MSGRTQAAQSAQNPLAHPPARPPTLQVWRPGALLLHRTREAGQPSI